MGCCCGKASYDIAGNRIRGGRVDELQGNIRWRGRHIIRVFAQVLELVHVYGVEDTEEVVMSSIDDDDQFDWLWQPMCDIPVHVNLACIQEGALYEYSVYAEENEICPLNSAITIPGTEIRKTGPYFVQWKDPYSGNVYGLNFFTEQETLRWLSSCFPPTFTPDMALRTTSSRPSYPCPPPPQPVTELPFFNNISTSPTDNEPLPHDHPSSTPERDAEEFFKIVLGPIKPLHSYKVKTKSREDEKMENCLSTSSIDECLHTLPKSHSVSSNIDDDKQSVPTVSFPSPPSQFNVSSSSLDETTDGGLRSQSVSFEERAEDIVSREESADENLNVISTSSSMSDSDEPDVALYQATGPIEINKILADIPEEEDEDLMESSNSLSLSLKRREQLHRGDAVDEDSLKSLSLLRKTVSSGSVDSTVQDFDKLLQDLQDSDLFEITRSPGGLSRQPSFADPPPVLPVSLPPGPKLSSIGEMEGEFNTNEFVNALKRLSVTSLENFNMPELPQSCPPGNLLSSRQSFSDVNRQQERRRDSQLILPPQLSDEDNSTSFQRHPSFLRHRFNPPEEFGSDSGVANSSDTEALSQEETFVTKRESRLLEALRIAELESKAKVTPSSVGHAANSQESSNWIMASKPALETDSVSRINAIRKSGWLEVKVLLIRKNKKVAMKSRRKWKKYWAILKGVNLLLYKWNAETLIMDDTPCDTKLDIKGCLAYPVTNHMKRDHLFSLSTATGNTYYMEAICQSAAEEWIEELHIASAITLTNLNTREETLKEIGKRISSTEDSIQMEKRMKNLTELQLSSVNANNKQSIVKQIASFTEDLDRLNVDLYRLKCYQGSLRGEELPNPQSILGIISKQTKEIVSKTGIFSVGSLQAVMSTRYSNPVDVPSLSRLSSRTSFKDLSIEHSEPQFVQRKRGFGLFSSGHSHSRAQRHLKFPSPIISSPFPTSAGAGGGGSDPYLLTFRQLLEPDPLMTGFGSVLTIEMQNGQSCEVPFKIDLTVGDVIFSCCKKFRLDPSDHFLLIMEENMESEQDAMIPNEDDYINNLTFKYLSVRQKFIGTIQFNKSAEESGLILKPDLRILRAVTHAVIGEVTKGSLVDQNGLIEGDEVLLINDIAVSHMSWKTIMETIKEPSVTLTVRTCRLNSPHGFEGRTTHVHLKDLVCPSPPTRGKRLSPEKLDNLIVPKPSDLTKSYSYEERNESKSMSSSSEEEEEEEKEETDLPNEGERVRQLIKSYSEVSKLVGIWKAYDEASFVLPETENVPGMTRSQKIVKCIQEIISTEIEHVKMLEVLVDRFLEPMQQEKFFPKERMAFLTSNIQAVVVQQKQFKGRIEAIPQVFNNEDPESIKELLQELCGSVEVHLDTFRQYSQFYAAQHELNQLFGEFQDKERLDQFFEARNPKQDPNFTLTNLLSKPVLRLLRYPLFFKAIRDQLDKTSEEIPLLDGIISSLLKVTEYINEVQRVSEAYINLFDELLEESKLAEFGVSVRMNQLLTHTSIMWLNARGPGMNKSWRKGHGPEMNCFVFETVLVILCLEKSSKRRPSKASIREGAVTTNDLLYSELLPLAQCKANNLPDSDGVTAMWQIVHKTRLLNSKPTTYIFRNKSTEEKASIFDLLQMAITNQLAIYGGGMSGSKSPTLSSISTYGSPIKGHSNSLLSQYRTDSVDSEYELTML